MRHADLAGSVLVFMIFSALAALLAGLIMQPVPAPVWRHVLFAVGVMPLILGAMLYFVPVLTRSAPAHTAVLLPAGAFVLGVGVVSAFLTQPEWLPALAAIGTVLVCIEIAWVWRRRQASLGGAHAGVDWYLCALAALVLALALIASRAVWPEYWAATRIIHLHLNLLGFLGLTAIGTLRVLLPTVLGERDPMALPFLRKQLPYAATGALAIGLGSGYGLPLAMLGVLMWLWPAVAMLRAVSICPLRQLPSRGAAIMLAAAALGWLFVLLAGAMHGLGKVSADTTLALLLYLFLLPLVTGATSHLLPVWRWPGVVTDTHGLMRARLTAYGSLRVAAFWSSAILTLAGITYAAAPAAIAMLAYLVQVVVAFMRVSASRPS